MNLIKIGSILTISREIVSNSGNIIFEKGQKVEVSEVIMSKGYTSINSFKYYAPRIVFVKIKDKIGEWSNSIFVEPFHNYD